jgi:DNA repair and recombination protein RAD52
MTKANTIAGSWEDQLKEINKTLPKDDISKRTENGRELSYLEGWKVFEIANEIFGQGRWDREIIDFQQLHLKSVTRKRRDGQEYKNAQAVYQAQVRVRVRMAGGEESVAEDVGYGVGEMGQAAGAIETAGKAAITDATKRAFRSLGNRFGNDLYDKDRDQKQAEEETPAPNAQTAPAGAAPAGAAPAGAAQASQPATPAKPKEVPLDDIPF